MKRAISSSLLSLSLMATAAGCGDDIAASAGDDTGTVMLSLVSVPTDASCLRVVITGSRTITKTYPLTAATSPTFAIDRAPAGVAQVDAQAFASACGSIASAVPTYVAETPAFVRVTPPAVANAAVHLIHNGRLSVSVDFEGQPWISTSLAPVDLAVIGDAPYGADQIADFPQLIADMNAATPAVAEIVHLGDIKNGSTRCDTSHFQFVFDNVNASGKPFLYTPGDNEWTDCHRANNGAYDPLERLATLRSMFYPVPGLSLGTNRKQVLSEAFFAGTETFVENQLWMEAGRCSCWCTWSAATTAWRPGTRTTPPEPRWTIRRAGPPRKRPAPPPAWRGWIARSRSPRSSPPPPSSSSCRRICGTAAR